MHAGAFRKAAIKNHPDKHPEDEREVRVHTTTSAANTIAPQAVHNFVGRHDTDTDCDLYSSYDG